MEDAREMAETEGGGEREMGGAVGFGSVGSSAGSVFLSFGFCFAALVR
jgi:hypothetical protein